MFCKMSVRTLACMGSFMLWTSLEAADPKNPPPRLPKISGQKESPTKVRPMKLALYRGQFTDSDLRNILFRLNTDYKPSFINVASLNRPLRYSLLGLAVESEGQIAIHERRQKHMEFNGLFVFRTPPLSRRLPVNLAFGEGLSFATRNPDLENRRKSWRNPNAESEYSKNLLNYLLFEMELPLPLDAYSPRAFVRIHHRSGIYGLMCPPTCGSNYVGYGIKFSY